MRTVAKRLLAAPLIAAIGGCSATSLTAPSPGPLATVTTVASGPAPAPALSEAAAVTGYYRAIVARKYRQAAGYLAPNAAGPDGRALTVEAFLRLAHMLDGEGGPVTRFSAAILPAMVVMTNDRARYGPYHAHLQMAKTSHGWVITALDRI